MFGVTPTAEAKVGRADLGVDRRIARIDFRRALEFSKRAAPFAATAVNKRIQESRLRVVWLEFDSTVKFPQRGIIVTMAPVIKRRQRQMCIRRSRSDC